MTNEQICLILNQYQYRNRTNWSKDDSNSAFAYVFAGNPANDNGWPYEYLDEFAAIAVCEKLLKQSSDDDIKAIVLSITQPLKDRIAELEKELNNNKQENESLYFPKFTMNPEFKIHSIREISSSLTKVTLEENKQKVKVRLIKELDTVPIGAIAVLIGTYANNTGSYDIEHNLSIPGNDYDLLFDITIYKDPFHYCLNDSYFEVIK